MFDDVQWAITTHVHRVHWSNRNFFYLPSPFQPLEITILFSHLLLWMSTCLSVSSLFNSVWYPLVPSILLQMTGSYSLWLDNCPYRYNTFSFSIYGWWTSRQRMQLSYCVTPPMFWFFPSHSSFTFIDLHIDLDIYLFIYYLYECAHSMVCMWRAEGKIQKSVLSLSVGFRIKFRQSW